MNKKILFLQFRTDQSEKHELKILKKNLNKYWSEMEIINLLKDPDHVFEVINNINKYNCIIIGGSGECNLSQYGIDHKLKKAIDNLDPLIDLILEKDVPTFAICLGLQLIGKKLGSRVVGESSDKGEVGSHIDYLTDEAKNDHLFKGLPQNMIVQHGHKEAIDQLPKGAILLQTNQHCPIQAFKYKNNIYAVQYHPELTKQDWQERSALYDQHHQEYNYQSEQSEVIKNLKESPESLALLKNFIKHYHG